MLTCVADAQFEMMKKTKAQQSRGDLVMQRPGHMTDFCSRLTYTVDSRRQWPAAPPPSQLPPVQVDPCTGPGWGGGVRR